MNEIFLRTIPLPDRVRAAVALDENGDYNIYVNTRLSHAEQLRAFEHERAHIVSSHFDPDLPAAACELEIARLECKKNGRRV